MRQIKQAAVLALLTIAPLQGLAALPQVVIEIRDHLFIPQTVRIPEGRKVRLVFINHDPSPEEIDSFDLNREKVIFGRPTRAPSGLSLRPSGPSNVRHGCPAVGDHPASGQSPAAGLSARTG